MNGWNRVGLHPTFHVPTLSIRVIAYIYQNIVSSHTQKTPLPRHTLLGMVQARASSFSEFKQCQCCSAGGLSKASCAQVPLGAQPLLVWEKRKHIKDYHLISFNLPYEYPLENNSTQGVFSYTFNLHKAYWKLPFLYPFSLDGELREILARRRNLSKW